MWTHRSIDLWTKLAVKNDKKRNYCMFRRFHVMCSAQHVSREYRQFMRRRFQGLCFMTAAWRYSTSFSSSPSTRAVIQVGLQVYKLFIYGKVAKADLNQKQKQMQNL
jgi:hypothetical protein